MIKQYSWVFLSFFAMFCTSISIILLKFIQETNLNILMTLIIGYLLLSVFSIIYILNNLVIFKETIYKLSFYSLFIVVFKVFLTLITQFTLAMAFNLCPNIGICHLIVNLNVIITLITGWFLFKQKINFNTVIGIIITFFGLSIVIYNTN